jgi:hypothetical protein
MGRIIIWISVVVVVVQAWTRCTLDDSCRRRPSGLSRTIFNHDDTFHLPTVWIEEAGDAFVDSDENLEDGEVCLRSVMAFASSTPLVLESSSEEDPRFLCAGALVQRPSDSGVCDAWTADYILEDGGPHLQFQGALQVLDDLLLFHLERHADNTILGLQTLVVKCGSLDSETTCASYMAAKSRGFRPLTELLRINSIYVASQYDHDVDGMVLDASIGRNIYEGLATNQG